MNQEEIIMIDMGLIRLILNSLGCIPGKSLMSLSESIRVRKGVKSTKAEEL